MAAAWYDPGGQGLHEATPPCEKEPAGQLAQTAEPASAEYVPGRHARQAIAPVAAEKRPAEHTAQTDDDDAPKSAEP